MCIEWKNKIGMNFVRKRFDKAGILWYTNQAVGRWASAGESKRAMNRVSSVWMRRRETGAILENDIEKNGKKQSDSEERNARLSVGADDLDKD